MKKGDILVYFALLGVVLLVIVPLNTVALDFFLIISITLSIIILITSLYITEPLQFSVFPSLLLIITLFRLGLNIAATKLILSNAGNAGKVISTFGHFVVGGNLVVGIIVYIIIVAMQFIVITKGSERVAEVSARFTLDAMPGKQMAIDADLNSGVIDDKEAKIRRRNVQREADFYGSMDGASKFVKGDSILGIIITLVNFVGGIIIGIVIEGMDFNEVIGVFALATIGDGLVSQIPALLVSTATGITVTRAASDENMANDLKKQLFGQPMVIFVAGIMLLLISLIPGMPKIPFIVLGGGLLALGAYENKAIKMNKVKKEAAKEEKETKEKRKPEDFNALLYVDPIEMELGYNVIPIVDVNQGGDLLDRVVAIRKQCAIDLGMIVPVIRIRDNMQLEPNKYVIKIKGIEVASGEVLMDHYLGMKNDDSIDNIEGIDTFEPAFGLAAKWISVKMKNEAELAGYTLIDVSSVISTHITEILKHKGYELLGRQQVQNLLDVLKKNEPVLVEDVVPKIISLGDLQKVLGNLLREGVPIKDLTTILETLGDYGVSTKDTDMLTEYVRQNMKRAITNRFIQNGAANAIALDPDLEQLIMSNIHQTKQGSYVTLPPEKLQSLFSGLKRSIDSLNSLGIQAIVITSPVTRFHFKKMTEQLVPDLIVLSYNEIEQFVKINIKNKITV